MIQHERAVDSAVGVDDVPVGETVALAAAACLFRSLGDPNRLAILRHLAATGEHRVRELTEHLRLAQSTVSKHCLCLADCGLVRSRPEGRATVYALAGPEVLTLLAAAEAVLATTGDAVALCPTYGEGAQ
ncbi:ArsR/SmtB family transcription factor [Blastococcus capsensis]|uniref:ArsR/SmtB family transcription factor n=1 Tax=Blastococcus capsensis TaxID=1564163 RepID=UPI002541F21F|nr:metalloregulator ArsR/SmtB family transcription factor [Blastococcus capsensis]MDK3258821.1 metalloregulator ArsR/SmtB family transcription factor [Blastococcus capsensis]